MTAPLLVTGGNGFIGSRVVRRLVADGQRVRCLLRPRAHTRRIDGLPLERCLGDVLDPPSLRQACAGCQAVIHLAAPASWSIADSALRSTIVDGTRNVLAAAREARIGRVVHVSSTATIAGSWRPIVRDEGARFELHGAGLPYAEAKHVAEAAAADAARLGTEVVVVNPAEVYGPEDDALVSAGTLCDVLRAWLPLAWAGGTSLVHVDDVAAGIAAALERGRSGERYILGGENLTVEQIVRATLAAAGRRRPVLIVPRAVLLAAVRGLSVLGLRTPLPLPLARYAVRYWFVDSSKAREELGWSARPARETLRETVAWLCARARSAHKPSRVGN
jgi:dihydroflavonol-4-reductase